MQRKGDESSVALQMRKRGAHGPGTRFCTSLSTGRGYAARVNVINGSFALQSRQSWILFKQVNGVHLCEDHKMLNALSCRPCLACENSLQRGGARSPTWSTHTPSNLLGTSARLGRASEQFFLPKSYSTHQLSWLMYM